MKVAVIGAGAWGTALAQNWARCGFEVTLWARHQQLADELDTTRCNSTYLPGIELHPSVQPSADLAQALAAADVAVMAVPSHGMRAIAVSAAQHLAPQTAVISAAKGFEVETEKTMSAVLRDVLGHDREIAVISGPNIAPEIARGLPAATVIAAPGTTANALRDQLNGPYLRCYSSTDVVGVEYGGAFKNVIAIAAGMCDGIGAGDNGKAAIITRGLAEMARLGTAAGANPETFAGLAGTGDCIVTCMSPLSRNRRLGEALGRGTSLAEAVAGTAVHEGVNATAVAARMAGERNVEMPIAQQINAILFGGKAISEALAELMSRDAIAEAGAGSS